MTALALTIAACSPKDAPTDPSTPPVAGTAKLKVGSWFAYNTYSTDADGVKIPGSEHIDTMTVTATGTFGGRSEVVVMESSDTHAQLYYHYPANGDIALALATTNIWPAFTWHLFPLGSRGVSTLPTVVDGAPGDRVTYRDTIRYAGVAQVALGGKVITASHVVETLEAVSDGSSGPIRTVSISDYLFDVDLGVMIGLRASVSAYDASGGVVWRGEGDRRSLIGYLLR